jgi:hypothetical protein
MLVDSSLIRRFASRSSTIVEAPPSIEAPFGVSTPVGVDRNGKAVSTPVGVDRNGKAVSTLFAHYDRKTILSTLANMFAFFLLLGVSIWLYTTYKNRTQYMSIIPDLRDLRSTEPILLDFKTPENLEPYNNLQRDGSLDFANLN